MRVRKLAPRERQLARLIARGWPNRPIAEEMRISEQTVKNMLRTLYRDFGLDNRTMFAIACTTEEKLKAQLEED
jgi:DNA-binding NarL/FixJ family response regulator